MARRLITIYSRPVDTCGPPTDGQWFAQDLVIHLDIKCEFLSLHGDSSLVFDPIPVAPEVLVFEPAPGASVKRLENKEGGQVVVKALGQIEATSRDDTLVVVPTDMETTICDAA